MQYAEAEVQRWLLQCSGLLTLPASSRASIALTSQRSSPVSNFAAIASRQPIATVQHTLHFLQAGCLGHDYFGAVDGHAGYLQHTTTTARASLSSSSTYILKRKGWILQLQLMVVWLSDWAAEQLCRLKGFRNLKH